MVPAGIAVTVETDVHAPLEPAFLTIVPIDLARIFRRFGRLPGVLGTHDQTGAWDHVGASRVVELGDGSHAQEQITAYEAPRRFAYRLDGFTGPLRRLGSHADGAWWFSDAGGGTTHVRWMYVFAPRAARATMVRAVIAPLERVPTASLAPRSQRGSANRQTGRSSTASVRGARGRRRSPLPDLSARTAALSPRVRSTLGSGRLALVPLESSSPP
jgi:hypothetical protein